jgi:uncharacterized protein (DUF1800 family)
MPSANLAYNRLTFGPISGDPGAPTDSTVKKWLADQLAASSSDAAVVAQALGAVTLQFQDYDATGKALPPQQLPLSSINSDETALWAAMKAAGNDFAKHNRPADEIQAASYIRAALSPNQLFEMMVECWHSHFNVESHDNGTVAASYPAFDLVIRANALGNFHDMLVAVGQCVPMMYYLNQAQSSATQPNENYAREVMELHTLGIKSYLGLTTPPGQAGTGYSDQDVQQAAQILAGWTIDQSNGAFIFRPAIHKSVAKTLLGHTIAADGKSEGDTMFSILASHSATAGTVATKLYRRFVADSPPPESDAMARMSQTFLANISAPNQIALMLQQLLDSAEFASSSGAKMKTPFEFIVSLLRAINVKINPSARLNQMLTQMGDPRFDWAPPNGRPDVSGPWMSNGSLLARWNAAEQLLAPATGVLQDNWDGLFDLLLHDAPYLPINLTNSAQAVTRAIANMLPGGVSSATRAALLAYAASPKVLGSSAILTDRTKLRVGLGLLIAAVAATPEFQFRG